MNYAKFTGCHSHARGPHQRRRQDCHLLRIESIDLLALSSLTLPGNLCYAADTAKQCYLFMSLLLTMTANTYLNTKFTPTPHRVGRLKVSCVSHDHLSLALNMGSPGLNISPNSPTPLPLDALSRNAAGAEGGTSRRAGRRPGAAG